VKNKFFTLFIYKGTVMKMKKMGQILKKRQSVLLISAVLAIALWFVVNTVIIPTGYATINKVPITTMLDNPRTGLSVISDTNETVTVYVSGPKLSISSLTTDDFIVQPKIEDITATGDRTVGLEINLPNKSNITILDYSPKTVNVTVARVETKQFEVTGMLTCDVPTDYHLESIAPKISTVSVKAPDYILSKIDSAKIVVNNLENKEPVLPIKLFDKQNTEITDKSIKIDYTETSVVITLYKVKTVKVKVNIDNPNNIDYENLINIDFYPTDDAANPTPDELKVAGPDEIIDSMPDEVVIKTFKLSEIKSGTPKVETDEIKLPGYVKPVSENYKYTIIITTNDVSYLEYTIDKNNIKLDNAYLNSGVNITITNNNLPVLIYGDKNTINAMKKAKEIDLVATVVLTADSSIQKGSYSQSVNITSNTYKNIWADKEYTVNIEVT